MNPTRVNADQLREDLVTAAEGCGFIVHEYGRAGETPLIALIRTASEGADRVYLSAGIHGDEPAGPFALLELLRRDALPQDRNYLICPLMNPGGIERGTRENPSGVDLNRDYTAFLSEEIGRHRDFLHRELGGLDLSLHLHEDWEAKGFYLYELNFNGEPSRAPSILGAAEALVPIEPGTRIDGHRASGGVIRPRKVPEVPGGFPEAIYVYTTFGGINYTLETPSSLPLERRVEAMAAAVLAALTG